MSDSDIAVKAVLIKYKENGVWHYMRKDTGGNIIGSPERKGALLFTPVQTKAFINHMGKIGFPFPCTPEPVK
jgi:hypothetical protein